MLIDCDACGVRGLGCADCVITALIGAPPPGVELGALPDGVELDAVERAALEVFVAAGLDPQFLVVTGAAEAEERRPAADDWLGAQQVQAQQVQAQQARAQQAQVRQAQADERARRRAG